MTRATGQVYRSYMYLLSGPRGIGILSSRDFVRARSPTLL